jgi:release factor glutamine methyltransferase
VAGGSRSVAEAVALATDVLARAGCATPRLDASVLFRHAAGGWDDARLIASGRSPVPADVAARFDGLVARRATREPVAYLVGAREFWSRTFRVDPRVLIPRPETEDVATAALAAIRERRASVGGRLRIVDVGTGSGILALTLAAELASDAIAGSRAASEAAGTAMAQTPRLRTATSSDEASTTHASEAGPPAARDVEIVAVDLSDGALEVARENAARILCSAGASEGNRVAIAWVRGDLTSSLASASIDVLVSNPPYVSRSELDAAAPELAREPDLALEGGDDDGLGVVRRLLADAARVLCRGGVLVSEIGSGQGAKVASLASSSGFDRVEVGRDLAGRDRMLVARRGDTARPSDRNLEPAREELEARGGDGWTRSSFEEGARSRARFESEAQRTPPSRSSSHRF